MDALAVGPALPDDPGGDLHAGDTSLGLLLVRLELLNEGIGDVDTGNVLIHELAHTGGLVEE